MSAISLRMNSEAVVENGARYPLSLDAMALSPDAIELDRDRIALDRDRIALDRDRIVLDRDRIELHRDRIELDRDRIALSPDAFKNATLLRKTVLIKSGKSFFDKAIALHNS
jgi:hypothetical protein